MRLHTTVATIFVAWFAGTNALTALYIVCSVQMGIKGAALGTGTGIGYMLLTVAGILFLR